jgi:two-component system sensor histidine kinase AlgZ
MSVEGFFLPSFCSIRALFLVIIFAELLAVIFTLMAVEQLDEFIQQLSLTSLLIQWVALSTAALYCLTREYLQRLGNARGGALAWLMLQAVTALVVLASLLLEGGMDFPAMSHVTLEPFVRALGVSMIVGLLVLHYLYLEYRGRMKMEAENVARLQALHSRIRPHFLFNSMNTVASLTRIDPAMAESVVEDLADLFRASLSDAGKLSNLGSELALAKQYLNIESQRLGTRLRVEWDLEGLPEEAVLPPLILQPLLENAVYHGIEPAEEGGEIVIHGRYRKNLINISIRNSQPEDSVESHREGNKMALENIHQRLDLLFGSKASLLVSHVDECYQMRLVFPHPWSPE